MTCFISDCKNEVVEKVTLSTGVIFEFCREHFEDFAYFFTKSALSKKKLPSGLALKKGYEQDMERMSGFKGKRD